MNKTLSDFCNRWVEECQGASKLNAMTWAEFCCPKTPAAQEALTKIFQTRPGVRGGFQNDCCRAYNVQERPRQLFPWVADAEWTLQRMIRRGRLPRSLLHPHGRAIRKPAGEGSVTQFMPLPRMHAKSESSWAAAELSPWTRTGPADRRHACRHNWSGSM